jgi:hypothetical protein
MMILLVTADNYLIMFVGWEGNLNCLKWLFLYFYITDKILNKKWYKNIIYYIYYTINSSTISYIIGSLLVNSYMKKNKFDKGVKITFIKCSDNIESLMLFYNYLVNNGYCKNKKPIIKKIISKNNKVLYYYEIDSYMLYNLDWLYNMFYKNNQKIIPENLKDFLSPICLTTWYLDSIYKLPKSNLFNLKIEDINYIQKILKDKYNLETVIRLESKGKVSFYIKNSSINAFSNIVKSHILPSLQYKLNSQHNKLTLWSQSSFNPKNLNLLNVRNYSIDINDIKYSAKYKKEYELSKIQKEALIGIILLTLIF